MPFYYFNQNNSGGRFVFEKDRLSHHVIIEAENHHLANDKAESLGIYFNGCADDRDCECCGDRWYPAYREGADVPSIYDEDVSDGVYGKNGNWVMKWMGDDPEGYIHYADGRVQPIKVKAKDGKV